jgi:hypothetical protein
VGIVDSRLVHSVGSSRKLAGGAQEEVVWPARRCGAELIPFDGGALRRAAVEVRSSSSSRVFGCGEFVVPSPESAWRSIRNKMLQTEAAIWSCAKTGGGAGCRLSGVVVRRLPVRGGAVSIQAIRK